MKLNDLFNKSEIDIPILSEKKRGVHPQVDKEVGSVIVFRRSGSAIQVLLGTRKSDPEVGQWVYPGGHIEDGETAKQGAARELEEEAGVKIEPSKLIFIDKQHQPKRSKLTHIFAIEVDPSTKIHAGTDLGNVKWVKLQEVPSLAFDGDKYIWKAFTKLFESPKEEYEESGSIITESYSPLDTRKGILIVLEGIDGVGKSTQSDNVASWCKKHHHEVIQTHWTSSKYLKKPIKKMKKDKALDPKLYSLMHAADFLERYNSIIKPALEEGKIVISDRYMYSSIVRDSLRGIDTKLHNILFKDIRKPDIIFYCKGPIDVCFGRLISDKGMSYYGIGMDLKLGRTMEENCILYQKKMDRLYNKLFAKENNCHKINMAGSKEDIYESIKTILKRRGLGS